MGADRDPSSSILQAAVISLDGIVTALAYLLGFYWLVYRLKMLSFLTDSDLSLVALTYPPTTA